MQSKSTRAFRTISEAGEELGLQPHVLRFWESKFSQIQPMKRSGGRRFYRPEDIELLRGIKILLHREKHPIKDVQKLIRIRGPQSVVDLGRSVQKASKPKDIKETNLVPKRIKPVVHTSSKDVAETTPPKTGPQNAPVPEPEHSSVVPFLRASASPPEIDVITNEADEQLHNKAKIDRDELELALSRLKALRLRWKDFE